LKDYVGVKTLANPKVENPKSKIPYLVVVELDEFIFLT
jgi:hypothetical protein